MKGLFVALCALLLASSVSLSAEIMDSFGQTVDSQLDQTVSRARKMRLPQYKSLYDINKSIEILKRVTSKKDDYFRAWFNLGLAYWQASTKEKSFFGESIDAFDRAIRIRDKEAIQDITIFNSAGWVSLSAGDYKQAEIYLIRGLKDIELGTEYTKEAIYTNLGRLYFYTQRFDLAEEYSSKAVEEFGNTDAAANTLQLIEKTKNLSKMREQKK